MNNVKVVTGQRLDLFFLFFIFLLIVISIISINQYNYGIDDHSISVPFVKASIRNNLYPNDFVLEQKVYHYTFLWSILGFFVKYLNLNIPIIYFIGYAISLYAIFLALYLIAMVLFEKKEVAMLSLFFLLFAKETLAGAATLDFIFIPRIAVLPVLLFSILYFLKKRYILSFLLQGVGFIVHPMTAVYVIWFIFVAAIVYIKEIGLKRFCFCIITLILSMSPIIVWKILYSPDSLKLLYADPMWIELLRLRSSHHIFPFSWDKRLFLQAGLYLCLLFISLKYKSKGTNHHIVETFTVAILTLCVAGIIFSEIIPISIVLILQLLRSFQFIIYFTILYFSNYIICEMDLKKSMFRRLIISFFSFGILYGATGGKYAFIAFLTLTFFSALYYHKYQKEFYFSKNFSLALIAIAFILGTGAFFFKRDNFSIYNVQDKKWLATQLWAKNNTDINDVFIVPSSLKGFRVESERTIYGDWKDGTLLNFNPDFGYEWFRRMKKLGYKQGGSIESSFRELKEEDFINLADEVRISGHKVFLVMFEERPALHFKIVYRNDGFIVYEIIAEYRKSQT